MNEKQYLLKLVHEYFHARYKRDTHPIVASEHHMAERVMDTTEEKIINYVNRLIREGKSI